MSRWGKPTKNRKHRDPRYFLNENIELEEQAADSGALPISEMQKHLSQYAEAVHGVAAAQRAIPKIMSDSRIRTMMEDLIKEIAAAASE